MMRWMRRSAASRTAISCSRPARDGKVLRPAKVTPTLRAGAGGVWMAQWIQIDEETGIDLAQHPAKLESSGEASQSWTGPLVQVEKYTGSIRLEPDKNRRSIVMPVGVE